MVYGVGESNKKREQRLGLIIQDQVDNKYFKEPVWNERLYDSGGTMQDNG